MTKLRQTIARRLKDAQNTAAMLTTFNEVDMTAVMQLRERRKEAFTKKFGVGVGIASFFVKAAIGALKAFPAKLLPLTRWQLILVSYSHFET